MSCRCDERKAWLRERGIRPLVGSSYGPVDAAQYVAARLVDSVRRRFI